MDESLERQDKRETIFEYITSYKTWIAILSSEDEANDVEKV